MYQQTETSSSWTKVYLQITLPKIPNYGAATGSNNWAALKDGYAYGNMIHFDCKNMDAALIKIKHYLDKSYSDDWGEYILDNIMLHPTFLQCWQYLLDGYGESDSPVRQHNLNLKRMQHPRTPNTAGFESIICQFRDDIEYATYSGLLPDGDDVADMAEQLILRSGQYPNI